MLARGSVGRYWVLIVTIRGDEARRDEVGKMSGHLERRDGGRERERERNETRNVIDLVRGNSEAMTTKRASRVDVSRAMKLRRERAANEKVARKIDPRISKDPMKTHLQTPILDPLSRFIQFLTFPSPGSIA